MPTAYIKKLASEGKGSVESLEKKWDEAKKSAAKQGHAEDWAYVTKIFQKHLNIASTEDLVLKEIAHRILIQGSE